jgi:hypothetical protein
LAPSSSRRSNSRIRPRGCAPERALPAEQGEKSGSLPFKRERLGELRRLAKLGETLLTALVAGKTVDPTPILKVYGSGSP